MIHHDIISVRMSVVSLAVPRNHFNARNSSQSLYSVPTTGFTRGPARFVRSQSPPARDWTPEVKSKQINKANKQNKQTKQYKPPEVVKVTDVRKPAGKKSRGSGSQCFAGAEKGKDRPSPPGRRPPSPALERRSPPADGDARFGSQDFTAQDFFQGSGGPGTFLLIGNDQVMLL